MDKFMKAIFILFIIGILIFIVAIFKNKSEQDRCENLQLREYFEDDSCRKYDNRGDK